MVKNKKFHSFTVSLRSSFVRSMQRSNSVSQSFKETQKRLLALRKEIADLESDVDGKNTGVLNVDILSSQLGEIGATLNALSKAVGSGTDMDLWQKKIQNAQNEQRTLVASLRELTRKRDLVKEEELAKAALLDRRYDSLESVKLDNEYKINASASNSTSMIAQYIEMSRGAVQEFRRQRQLLGEIKRKLLFFLKSSLVRICSIKVD